MRSVVRPSLVLFVLTTLLLGVVYPAAVTVFARTFFPGKADGSLIVKEGKVLGSRLIGQPFSDPKYFWSRPSATPFYPYNAASSGASNLSPANPVLIENVKKRIGALKAADPGNPFPVPVDLVTSSGSGLDPHISPAAASYQAARVARARGLSEAEVRQYIGHFTERRAFGFIGEERVNVLLLNLALDGKL